MTGTDPQGFTLLEVMLATLILGLVMAMLTLSLSGSLRVVEQTDELDALYHRARVALERISDDLTGAVLVDDGEFTGQEVEAAQTPQTLLSLISRAHIDLTGNSPARPLARIRYQVVRDPDAPHLLVLLRDDQLYLSGREPGEAGNSGLLLCDRLLSVRFRYLDGSGREMESWHTPAAQKAATDQQRQLPAAVSCRLEFGDPRDPERQEPVLSLGTTIVLPTAVVRSPR